MCLEELFSRRKLCAVGLLIMVVMTVVFPALPVLLVPMVLPVVGMSVHYAWPGNHHRRLRHDHWCRMDKHRMRGHDYRRWRSHHDGKRQSQPDRDMHPSCLYGRG